MCGDNTQITQILNNLLLELLRTNDLSIENLKILLLIIYNECFINNNNDNLINSYLTLILKYIIDIEDNKQIQLQKEKELKDMTVNFRTP